MNAQILKISWLIFLGLALILLALVSLSTPIIKTISVLHAEGGGQTFDIGLYGACVKIGQQEKCTSLSIGMDLATLGSALPGGGDLAKVMDGISSTGLFLHALAAISILATILLGFANNKFLHHLTFYLTLFIAFVATIAFVLDLYLFVQARAIIEALSALDATFSTGFYMALASVFSLYLASFLAYKHRRASAGK